VIYQSRCRKCRGRRTFKQDPQGLKPCPCGGVYVVDSYRQSKAEGKRFGCRCSGFPWESAIAPPRKGSYSIKNHWYCEYAQPSQHSVPDILEELPPSLSAPLLPTLHRSR